MAPNMEILSVGNELLIGKVLNTNSQWLAKHATYLGIKVKRITVLPDDLDETSQAIKETLQRKPHFLLITGGLGPTFDDKTLETIAKALNRKLTVNPEALEMVKGKYAPKGYPNVELTPPRSKMATIPENSKPIHNPLGTAPGVKIDLENTVIIALPGVPREMEAIFEETIVPLLQEASDGICFYEESIYVDEVMESVLAPAIDETMRENPQVYIKSHTKGVENQPHIELHFSTTARRKEEAEERLYKSVAKLSDLIIKNHGKIYSE
jgi:molybdenum cofactor synthesis domain-containing protein